MAVSIWGCLRRSGDSRAACQVLEQLQPELAAMGDAFAQAAGLSYLALALEQSGHASDAGAELFTSARAVQRHWSAWLCH